LDGVVVYEDRRRIICEAYSENDLTSQENGMVSVSLRASRTALLPCLLLWGASTIAQAKPTWVDPPGDQGDTTAAKRAASPESVRRADQVTLRAQDARALAVNYLNLWSAPNRLTLTAASSFYGPTVLFHGRERTIGSVLAEKRRFTARWPQRNYRYRPETTMVACESDGSRCTVWAIFDFSAARPNQDRRSHGIGEHELVVSLSGGRPVIVAETSRVLQRRAFKND
jgi:hypothetical protein